MKRIAYFSALFWLAPLAAQSIPPGFTSIFPGTGLSGWHISQENHHGDTKTWKVENGVLSVTQDREGNGGILLTGKRYRDFEVYVQIKPDYGCDGGLFLRSSEKGEAYQVTLDYLPGGSIGGIYGERLKDVQGAKTDWEQHWKKDDWNSIRARIEGDVPQINVWLNGHQITDWKDTKNHAAGDAVEGMIALQVHGGKRCSPGLFHRYRAIAVRPLR